MSQKRVRISKFLSLVLRHRPETLGLSLDPQGWVEVDLLLGAMEARGKGIDRDFLVEVVRTNDKQRFALSDDGRRIRASQGHSVEIDLGLEPRTPPRQLFHGTATRSVGAILKRGLLKMGRRHVHLSDELATAKRVGSRHGRPVVLKVDSAAMARDGYSFFRSANGVWLVDSVPVGYLCLWPDAGG